MFEEQIIEYITEYMRKDASKTYGQATDGHFLSRVTTTSRVSFHLNISAGMSDVNKKWIRRIKETTKLTTVVGRGRHNRMETRRERRESSGTECR